MERTLRIVVADGDEILQVKVSPAERGRSLTAPLTRGNLQAPERGSRYLSMLPWEFSQVSSPRSRTFNFHNYHQPLRRPVRGIARYPSSRRLKLSMTGSQSSTNHPGV